jgi:FAD/FMN-containing dehydrogenase
MTHGIEIHMSQLNSIVIAQDGETATIGGGVIAKNLTDALWAAGKQTGKYMINFLLAINGASTTNERQ